MKEVDDGHVKDFPDSEDQEFGQKGGKSQGIDKKGLPK